MGSNYLIKVVIEGDNCDIFVLKYFVLMELQTINHVTKIPGFIGTKYLNYNTVICIFLNLHIYLLL